MQCGYDRAGLEPDALCPECGSPPVHLRRDKVLSPGASRATIALGLGTLSWIGIVGFGIIAVLLGIGAVCVSVSSLRCLAGEEQPHRQATACAIGGLLLGVSGAGLGVLVTMTIVAALF